MIRRFFPIILIFILVTAGVIIYTLSQETAPAQISPSPTPYALDSVNSWNELSPGASKEQDITAKLGAPLSVVKTPNGDVYSYPSTNKYWKNEVTVKGNTVLFIIERLFPPANVSLKSLSSSFSTQPTKLYGPDFEGGTFLLVYPKDGIAFLANTSQDTVYQKWYFQPTTLSGFLSLPQANFYSITPKPEMEGGN
jgi:hypothetical protein